MSDFETWLDQNKNKFDSYTLEEIQRLAIACGFSVNEVIEWRAREHFRRAA